MGYGKGRMGGHTPMGCGALCRLGPDGPSEVQQGTPPSMPMGHQENSDKGHGKTRNTDNP